MNLPMVIRDDSKNRRRKKELTKAYVLITTDIGCEREICKKLLEHASEIVKNKYFDLKVTEILREGHVPSTIVDIANDIEVDLIIIGSRGLSGIKSMFLGGVSKHVVEHCKQPILIVK